MHLLLEESGVPGTSSTLVRIDLSKTANPPADLEGSRNGSNMSTIQELSPAPSIISQSPKTPIHDIRERMEELYDASKTAEEVELKSPSVETGHLSNAPPVVHGEISAA